VVVAHAHIVVAVEDAVLLVVGGVAVNTYTVDVSDWQARGQAVVGRRLPEPHHEALGAEHARVSARANLGGCPEKVVAGRVLGKRLGLFGGGAVGRGGACAAGDGVV
jgi:hypothetical protein